MKCPFCSANNNGVLDSRETEDGQTIRRRRKCGTCERRFTTYERVEESPLFIVKRDGRRQLFDRRRILAGLQRACEKRPIASDKIEQISLDVERRAYELGEKELASVWVGEQVMAALRDLDQVAYVRFASVYRSFRDVAEFAEELHRLQASAGPANGAKAQTISHGMAPTDAAEVQG